MMWIGTHVLGWLLLVGLGFATGDLIRRWAFPQLDAAHRHLASLCLGLAAWTLIAVALAALGWLQGWAVLGSGLMLIAMLVWVCRHRWASESVAGPAPPTAPSMGRSDKLFLALMIAMALLPTALMALVPTVSWDASAYHLTVPRLYLEHGGFRPIPFNVYSNWPLGTEMLFALAMLVDDHVLAKLLHFAFGLATLYAIFLGVRFEPVTASRTLGGLLAMTCFLANGVVAFEMRVAYVDLAIAFYFTAAFLFLRRWQRSPEDRGALIMAGVSAGLMAGSKLNGFVGVVPLAWLFLPALRNVWRHHGWRGGVRSLACFAAPVAVLWWPWLIKSMKFTGNPLYPLLHGLFGGPDWSPALATQLSLWQRSIGMGREALDYLLLPWRVITSGGPGYAHFDGEVGIFWLLLLPVAFWGARRSADVRQLLAVGITYFGLWAFTSQQLRLLIPALPMFAMACGHAVADLFADLPRTRRRFGRFLLLAAAVAILAGSYRTTWTSSWNAARRMLATPPSAIAQTAKPPIFHAVEGLPPEARLLFLNTNQGFFCHRDYLADSFFEASQIADWLAPFAEAEAVQQALKERGVTHLLLDRQPRPVTYPPALLAMVQSAEWVVPVTQSPDGRFLLFALR